MKWILGVCSLLCVALSTYSSQSLQSHYSRVEAYEIRPGLLAMPKYAADGTLCQVSIEKLHVQADGVELGAPTIPRELTLKMIDELAPPSERGKATVQFAGNDYLDVTNGSARIAVADYEDVSIQIYTTTSAAGDITAIMQWKKSLCASPNVSDPVL